MYQRLAYHEIFGEPPSDIKEYIKGISKETALQTIPYFINAAFDKTEYRDAKELIEKWFSYDSVIRRKILRSIPENSYIINITSSLQWAEIVLQGEWVEIQTITNEEVELNILKAYLILNSKQNELEEIGYKNLPPMADPTYLNLLFLTINYHISDLQYYDLHKNTIIQLVKSTEYFLYLSSQPSLTSHLNIFLTDYNCTSWQEWLKKLSNILLPIIKDDKLTFFDYGIPDLPDREEIDNYFMALTINDQDNFQHMDFIALRSHPIIKIDEYRYRIVSKMFLIEKLYKSTLFNFSLIINNKVPPENKIKDFRSIHCDYFSERILLYRFLQKSFPKKWKHVSGEEFKAQGYIGEPDYYLRFKNKVFIFENKDVILKGSEKQSRDPNILFKALYDKFYKIEKADGSFEGKAIMQIIENIRRLIIKYYTKIDPDYSPENLTFFPILVVHDKQFDALGVNSLIKLWFREEIISQGLPESQIQPITVINIDSFILFQELFIARGNIKFEDLINSYHKATNVNRKNYSNINDFERAKQMSFISFSTYLDLELLGKKKVKYPKRISKYLKDIWDV